MPHPNCNVVIQPKQVHTTLYARRTSNTCSRQSHIISQRNILKKLQLCGCSRHDEQVSLVIQEVRGAEGGSSGTDNEKKISASASALNKQPGFETQRAETVLSNGQQPQAAGNSDAVSEDLLQRVASTALLISPFFFWGTSMVAMKEVLPHATPLLISTLRLVPAGVVLVGWAAANGRQQPQTPVAWAWITAFALVDAAAFQGFLAEGLQRTAAGLGSVIIDSQPLSVAVLAALLFGEKLKPAGFVGLFLGVLGLLMLELPPQDLGPLLQAFGTPHAQQAITDISSSTIEVLSSGTALVSTAPQVQQAITDISSAAAGLASSGAALVSAAGVGSADSVAALDGNWSLWDSGEWWMLLAAQAMAVGTVMVRGVAKHCDPFIATGWHMIIGGMMLLGFIAATDAPSIGSSLAQFGVDDYLAMAYVSLLGGAASYGVFFDNATRGNLTALSSLTFLTPMFAAAGGFLVLHETLTPLQLTGAAVTLSAVYLINK